MERAGHPHILIIGGGIAGAALSLFLQKAGISCAVYEAYPYTERVGGGLNIASNGMKVLAELGLAQTLIAKGTPTYASVFQNELSWTLARIPYGDPAEFEQPCVSMSRATLFEALVTEMKRKGIDMSYEKRLTFITEEDDAVIAHFADGTSARGDLLVGADGRPLRRAGPHSAGWSQTRVRRDHRHRRVRPACSASADSQRRVGGPALYVWPKRLLWLERRRRRHGDVVGESAPGEGIHQGRARAS